MYFSFVYIAYNILFNILSIDQYSGQLSPKTDALYRVSQCSPVFICTYFFKILGGYWAFGHEGALYHGFMHTRVNKRSIKTREAFQNMHATCRFDKVKSSSSWNFHLKHACLFTYIIRNAEAYGNNYIDIIRTYFVDFSYIVIHCQVIPV